MIFADKGYKGATVREICRQAGVNVAAVNYYFGDKEGLYKEVVNFAHPADIPRKPEFPPGMPPQEKLKAFIFGFLSHVRSLPSHSWHLRLIMRELTNPMASCRESVRAIFQTRFNEVLEILSEIVPPSTPDYILKRLGFSIFGQCIVYRRDGVPQLLLGDEEVDRHFQVEQLTEHIFRVTLCAIGLAEPFNIGSSDDESNDVGIEETALRGDAS